ncbi:NUDIX hydrolase [Candidatus Wolfebacteria bacterium]|nr:NUDIX hydrolase [Candidatus Wolfebacteria bacterium]
MKISQDAQAVIIKYNKSLNDYEFLLIYRFDKEKNEDHYRLVKGGVKIKKEESAEDAVLREIAEEVGIKECIIASKLCDYSYASRDVIHEVAVFLVKIASEKLNNIQIDSHEEGGNTIKSVKWASAEEAIKLLNFQDEKNLIKLAQDYLLKI